MAASGKCMQPFSHCYIPDHTCHGCIKKREGGREGGALGFLVYEFEKKHKKMSASKGWYTFMYIVFELFPKIAPDFLEGFTNTYAM